MEPVGGNIVGQFAGGFGVAALTKKSTRRLCDERRRPRRLLVALRKLFSSVYIYVIQDIHSHK